MADITLRIPEAGLVAPNWLTRPQISATLQNIENIHKTSICMVIPEEVYVPLNKLGVYSMRSDLVSNWVPEPYMRQQLSKFNLNANPKITVVKKKQSCEPVNVLIDYSSLSGKSS